MVEIRDRALVFIEGRCVAGPAGTPRAPSHRASPPRSPRSSAGPRHARRARPRWLARHASPGRGPHPLRPYGSGRGAAPVRGGHAAPADALRRIRRAVRGAAPPLRQGYSLTETGPTCLDVGPPERVERDTVGTPLHDIDLRVGDDPTQPCEPERVGRIWVRPPRRARPGPARDRATGGRPAIAKRRRSPLELTSNS